MNGQSEQMLFTSLLCDLRENVCEKIHFVIDSHSDGVTQFLALDLDLFTLQIQNDVHFKAPRDHWYILNRWINR